MKCELLDLGHTKILKFTDGELSVSTSLVEAEYGHLDVHEGAALLIERLTDMLGITEWDEKKEEDIKKHPCHCAECVELHCKCYEGPKSELMSMGVL